MKAIIIREFGDVDCLLIEEVSEPKPAPDEITIDVAYAGIGFVDTLVRAGKFDFVKLPVTPGIEVSGHVRASGQNVEGFAKGQSVAALLTDFTSGGMGGYAQITRAKAALTIQLSAEYDLAIAAATIVNGATAFMAMEGGIEGNTVAISGASGGLGQSLITAAASCGATKIIAVSGNPARYAALVRAGAHRVVSPNDLATMKESIDAAFDTVGGNVRLGLLRHLKPSGRLVLLGNASGADSALPGDDIWLRHLKIEGLSTGGLSHLFPARIAKAAQVALSTAIGRTNDITIIDFEDVKEAHRGFENPQGNGKFVFKVR
jgi:NADPH:quinone reductase